MDEVYTCTCGGQAFMIHDDTITCANCGVEYMLRILPALEGGHVIERPEYFNKRIRDDLFRDLINK